MGMNDVYVGVICLTKFFDALVESNYKDKQAFFAAKKALSDIGLRVRIVPNRKAGYLFVNQQFVKQRKPFDF